jgi:arsenate reductase
LHNPGCSTSRGTLAILRETPGLEVEVIEYLKHPPTREKLAALYARAGMTPRQGLRTKNSPAADLCAALGLLDAGGDTILDAMIANPILIERPLVETDKGVVLARPVERVQSVL